MILNSEENSMLTRREIRVQLRRVGIDRLSMLKHDCREYEDYLAFHYDYEAAKKGKVPNPSLNNLLRKGISHFMSYIIFAPTGEHGYNGWEL